MSLPGNPMRGDNGERPACRRSISCRPGGAWIGLNMVNFRFGGAKKPPDNVSCVRIAPVVIHLVVSMVSADFEIRIDDDCCNALLVVIIWCCCWYWCCWSVTIPPPSVHPPISIWAASSAVSATWVDALRWYLSGLVDDDDDGIGGGNPAAGLVTPVSECADVERTNWRTCFCWAVRNVVPWCDDWASGCWRKLWNFPFEVDDLVEDCWKCFSLVTMLALDWALCWCWIKLDVDEDDWLVSATIVLDVLDCKLWLRELCEMLRELLFDTVELPDLVVVVMLVELVAATCWSSSASPGVVTMYWGVVSSKDIFLP